MRQLLLALAILVASAGISQPPAEANPSTLKEWWEQRHYGEYNDRSFRIEPAAYVKSGNTIIAYADNYIGYTERKNRKELTQKLKIDPVSTPWCAGFVNYVLETTGFRSTGSYTAASYSNYGKKVSTPIKGDIVLVRRKGGSGRHVGFFHSFTTEEGVKYVVVLGGNQDGSVSLKKYPVRAVTGYRRPVN